MSSVISARGRPPQYCTPAAMTDAGLAAGQMHCACAVARRRIIVIIILIALGRGLALRVADQPTRRPLVHRHHHADEPRRRGLGAGGAIEPGLVPEADP